MPAACMAGKAGVEVGHVQRDVVQALAALVKIAPDGGLRHGRLEQLDTATAHGEHGCPDLFVGDRFLMSDTHAEQLVEGFGLFDRTHSDTQMIQTRGRRRGRFRVAGLQPQRREPFYRRHQRGHAVAGRRGRS